MLEALLESLTWKSRCRVWEARICKSRHGSFSGAACRQLNAAAGGTISVRDRFLRRSWETLLDTERCLSLQAAVISLSDPRMSFNSQRRQMPVTAMRIDRTSKRRACLGGMPAVVSKMSCRGRLIAVSFLFCAFCAKPCTTYVVCGSGRSCCDAYHVGSIFRQEFGQRVWPPYLLCIFSPLRRRRSSVTRELSSTHEKHCKNLRLPPNCDEKKCNRFARLCLGSWTVVIRFTIVLRWQLGSLTGREATEFNTFLLLARFGGASRPRSPTS